MLSSNQESFFLLVIRLRQSRQLHQKTTRDQIKTLQREKFKYNENYVDVHCTLVHGDNSEHIPHV